VGTTAGTTLGTNIGKGDFGKLDELLLGAGSRFVGGITGAAGNLLMGDADLGKGSAGVTGCSGSGIGESGTTGLYNGAR
jgi:hypothetical protein